MVEEVRLLEAEAEFDLAELFGLEARRGAEHVAELEIIDGRQRREHVPRQGHHRLDAADPRHRLVGLGEAVLPDTSVTAKPQLVQHLLHPQLLGLVDDDEQHFVVEVRQRLLRARAAGRASDSRHRSCRRASRSWPTLRRKRRPRKRATGRHPPAGPRPAGRRRADRADAAEQFFEEAASCGRASASCAWSGRG